MYIINRAITLLPAWRIIDSQCRNESILHSKGPEHREQFGFTEERMAITYIDRDAAVTNMLWVTEDCLV